MTSESRDNKFGKILRDSRRKLKLSMMDIAEAVGVSEGTVSRWECGKRTRISFRNMVLLSKKLNLSLDFLLDYTTYGNIKIIKDESDERAVLKEEISRNLDFLSDKKLMQIGNIVKVCLGKEIYDQSKFDKEAKKTKTEGEP